MPISQDTYNKVKPHANKHGVPDWLWQSVALMESSGNPRAYNQSGAYGLFQLLVGGGQGDAAIRAGHTRDQLFDPSVNAQYAMPAIAATWNRLKGEFTTNGLTLDWWIKFAAQSGHPGGGPGNSETRQAAQSMLNHFKNLTGANMGDPISNLVKAMQQAGETGGENLKFGTEGPSVKDVATQAGNLMSFLEGLTVDNIRSGLIRTGVFLVAFALLAIGLFVIAKEQTDE